MSRVKIATMLSASLATRSASSFSRRVEQRRDLERCTSLDDLAPRDGERPRLVRPRNPRRALRDIETSPLRRPQRLIAKLHIANLRIAHEDEHLERHPIDAQSMMRKQSAV